MLDFKKLAEVTSIEELPEGINVLVNDNGVVKQVPANKVGEMVPDILKKAAESGDGFGYTDGNELHQIDSKYIKKEEIAPEEVTNAVETHGMGWTDEDDTVHQIDEKYIPSSGGAMIVNASLTDKGDIALDKTYEEISSALPNVVIVVSIEGGGDTPTSTQYILPHTFTLAVGDVTTLYFSCTTFYRLGAGVTYIEIKINSSNEVEATSTNLKEFIP